MLWYRHLLLNPQSGKLARELSSILWENVHLLWYRYSQPLQYLLPPDSDRYRNRNETNGTALDSIAKQHGWPVVNDHIFPSVASGDLVSLFFRFKLHNLSPGKCWEQLVEKIEILSSPQARVNAARSSKRRCQPLSTFKQFLDWVQISCFISGVTSLMWPIQLLFPWSLPQVINESFLRKMTLFLFLYYVPSTSIAHTAEKLWLVAVSYI